MINVINFVAFQACWFACVYFAGKGMGWPGPLAVAIFAAWQLTRPQSSWREWVLVIAVCLFGLLLDTAWVQSDVLSYSARGTMPEIAPAWIVALWANFALTMNHSLGYLRGKPWLGAVLGAVGGPLSYYVAIQYWDAARAGFALWISLALIALAWAILTPTLFALASRLCPTRSSEETSAA